MFWRGEGRALATGLVVALSLEEEYFRGPIRHVLRDSEEASVAEGG